jgi:hypothetical protein
MNPGYNEHILPVANSLLELSLAVVILKPWQISNAKISRCVREKMFWAYFCSCSTVLKPAQTGLLCFCSNMLASLEGVEFKMSQD